MQRGNFSIKMEAGGNSVLGAAMEICIPKDKMEVDTARQKVLEKNRRAQERYRSKKRAAEEDLLAKIQNLQRQLSNASLETENCKRQNEVLGNIAKLRESEIKVLEMLSCRSSAPEVSQSGATSKQSREEWHLSWHRATLSPQECRELSAMDGRTAALRWRDYVHQMMPLLAHVEVPRPSGESLESLEVLAREAGAFAWMLSVVNPVVGTEVAAMNVQTLEYDSEELRRNLDHWQSKVDAIMLSADQKLRVLVASQRLDSVVAPVNAQIQSYNEELKRLLPHVSGEGAAQQLAAIRSEELVEMIRKKTQIRHEAWLCMCSTILGQIMNPVQFVRYSVNAYPSFPLARAVCLCTERTQQVYTPLFSGCPDPRLQSASADDC